MLLGMSLLLAIFHFYWEPSQLARAKADFTTDIRHLMRFGESDLVRNLLENDTASLFSAIEFQQDIKHGSWFNYQLYNEDGKLLYPLFQQQQVIPDNPDFIHIYHPLELSGTRLGYIEVDVDWSIEKDKILQNLKDIKTIIFEIMLAIMFISLFTQYRIIYIPLKSLKQAAEHISQGNFDVHLDENRKDEIGDLTCTFNKMKQDLKNSRDELIKSIELAEAANISKSQFLATMSHEIRTPMNGVIGTTELLEDTTLNNEQKEYVEIISHSGNNLLKIINDILDFSKLDADMAQVEFISFDLERVCLESMELVAGNSNDTKLEFIFDYNPECPRLLMGDPSRMRQVLINLLGNAVKFTQRGFIRLGISSNKTDNGNELLRVEIQDTGIGLKPQVIDQLFDKFTQADSSTTRMYGGTGLGLAITRKLITLMGGEIGVNSIYGEGSTFWITLPLTIAEEPSPLVPSSLAGIHILLVDDNEQNCHIYKNMLRHMGANATIVTEPQQVMGLLTAAAKTTDPYRIAVLDHMMPNMSGLELGQEIRKTTQLNDLKLLIFSSAGQKGDAAMFARAGFDAYLNKLSRYNTLQSILSVMLNHHSTSPIITKHSLEDAKKSSQASGQTFNASILLVEDILPNQIIAKKFLTRMGLDVTVANNGKEAIDKHTSQHFDLILMDCRMPVMDGFAATRAIRQIEKDNHSLNVPIIALTANASKNDHQLCTESGMDDVITKPFRRDDLSDSLAKWLPDSVKEDLTSQGDTSISDKTSEILDTGIYQKLQQEMGKDFEEMLNAYYSDMQDHIKSLENCSDSSSTEDILRYARSIKSISAVIGALRLSNTAANFELAVGAGKLEGLEQSITQLNDEYNSTKQQLERFLQT